MSYHFVTGDFQPQKVFLPDREYGLALDALVFGEFLEAYCAAAADLLGAESCERGMLLGLDLLCDLSMKR